MNCKIEEAAKDSVVGAVAMFIKKIMKEKLNPSGYCAC
jgi:hypothetical protein